MILNYSEINDKVESVKGFLPPPQPERLFNLVFFSPLDSVTVEIGSFFGKSSTAMGFACLGTKRKVYCIDVWENELVYQEWLKTIHGFGLSEHVIPIRGWSGEVLSNWEKFIKEDKVHLVFIDGGHGLANALLDFIWTYPKVVEGGTIAFHDVADSHPEVLKAWNVFKSLLVNHEQVGSLASGNKVCIK